MERFVLCRAVIPQRVDAKQWGGRRHARLAIRGDVITLGAFANLAAARDASDVGDMRNQRAILADERSVGEGDSATTT